MEQQKPKLSDELATKRTGLADERTDLANRRTNLAAATRVRKKRESKAC